MTSSVTGAGIAAPAGRATLTLTHPTDYQVALHRCAEALGTSTSALVREAIGQLVSTRPELQALCRNEVELIQRTNARIKPRSSARYRQRDNNDLD